MTPVKAAPSTPLSVSRAWVHKNCGGTTEIIGNHLEVAQTDKYLKCSDYQHSATCWIYKVTYIIIYEVYCPECGATGTIPSNTYVGPVEEHRTLVD